MVDMSDLNTTPATNLPNAGLPGELTGAAQMDVSDVAGSAAQEASLDDWASALAEQNDNSGVNPAAAGVFQPPSKIAPTTTRNDTHMILDIPADMNAVNNAARIASGVGAGAAAPALGVGAVLQTVVGLAVVIALVFGSAWIARRLGFQPAKRSGLVKTIGGASLGGKERVAVVEIGDTWLVLGAAPGNVRLLHRMPAGTTTAGEATDVAAFSGDAQDALPG